MPQPQARPAYIGKRQGPEQMSKAQPPLRLAVARLQGFADGLEDLVRGQQWLPAAREARAPRRLRLWAWLLRRKRRRTRPAAAAAAAAADSGARGAAGGPGSGSTRQRRQCWQ